MAPPNECTCAADMKIFLVEDSPEILRHLHTLIDEVGGMSVVGQADGEENALEGIFGALPNLIILDLSLASGNGIAVLRQVKARHPEIRVIVLTNNCHPQYRKRCRLLGAEHFLDKTRDFEKLAGLLVGMTGARESA